MKTPMALVMGDFCDWNFSVKAEKLLQDGMSAATECGSAEGCPCQDRRNHPSGDMQTLPGNRAGAFAAKFCKLEERVRLEAMIGRLRSSNPCVGVREKRHEQPASSGRDQFASGRASEVAGCCAVTAGVASRRSPISSAARIVELRQKLKSLIREFSRIAMATADKNGRL